MENRRMGNATATVAVVIIVAAVVIGAYLLMKSNGIIIF